MLRRVMRGGLGRLLIFVLFGVALGAGLIAAGMLPDQTWMGGLYDAADEDAVLLLVWDQAVPTFDLPLITHPLVWVAVAPSSAPWLAASRSSIIADSRAPPLS